MLINLAEAAIYKLQDSELYHSNSYLSDLAWASLRGETLARFDLTDYNRSMLDDLVGQTIVELVDYIEE